MKKRLLSALLALCMLPALMGAAAVPADDVFDVCAVVDGVAIGAVPVDGENYLFLPANADVRELSLQFALNGEETDAVVLHGENGSADAANPIDLLDLTVCDDRGRYAISAETDGATEHIYVMSGAGLPTMYLTSENAEEEGRTWVDASKKHEAEGSMLLLDETGESIYDGELTQIKARGNSTFTYYPKKAYQIKLAKKSDLLGTGEKVKTWVLLANYGDATLTHDKFFKDLAAELGMAGTTSCGWVNLYYDGEYRGVYLLSEKISVGGDSVDITDMEELYEERNETYGDDMQSSVAKNAYGQIYYYTEGLTEVEDVTGGWLIELNLDRVDEACGFFTTRKTDFSNNSVAFNVKSPEFAGQEAMAYISEYYQAFENAVFATDENGNYTGYNAETGKYFYEYCDLESLVQVFLIQELGLNPDGFYSSMYFRKDVGEMMYAGPIWDWDMSLGTGWKQYYNESLETYHYLAAALIQIPQFRAAVEEYYTQTFAPTVEAMLEAGGTVDTYFQTLTPNALMNYQLWPYVRVGHPDTKYHLWPSGIDYPAVTEFMKNWLVNRVDTLNGRFYNADCALFVDVATTDWEYEAVRFAAKNGILNGVGDNRFDPDGTATRGMICTILARMAGEDTTPAAGESWMQPGLDWATANGVSDGLNPTAPITREQLATMLWRYAGEPTGEGSLDAYTDGANVSTWAAAAMEWAIGEGIFQGDGNRALNPGGTATRAEIAQVIFNYLGN